MALTKNNFYSYITIALLSVILISATLSSLNLVSSQTSGTEVTGIITSNATWTLAGSPYILTGNVRVNEGVTLTIEAGTTVNLDSYYIQVDGTLTARGTDDNPINFTGNITFTHTTGHTTGNIYFSSSCVDWDEASNSGSIIEKANFNIATISIEDSSPKVNCINLYGNPPTGISISGGSPVISNSTIIGVGDFLANRGISCAGKNNALILGNTISGWRISNIWVYEGNPIIEQNLIIGSRGHLSNVEPSAGISIPYLGPNPIIRNNTITNNTPAGIIMNGSPEPLIINNNIYGNSYSIYLLNDVQENIEALNNWWGVVDAQTINQSIYDFYDDFNLGIVDFAPFLFSPNTAAPTYTNASASVGGSISPSGITKLNYGDDIAFTIAADSGYHLVDVLVNGTSIGATGSCSIEDISGATEIIANFEIDPTPTPTPTPSPTPTVTPTPTLNPTPSPTPTASPSPTPTATVEPTPSPTPESTPSLTPIPTDNQEDSGNFFFSPTFLIVLGVVVVVSVVIGGVLIWKKW